MCRSQLSVGWDGTIYDCDFNLALGFPANVENPHILSPDWSSLGNRTIVTGEHCFGCTAGAGSSCNKVIINPAMAPVDQMILKFNISL